MAPVKFAGRSKGIGSWNRSNRRRKAVRIRKAFWVAGFVICFSLQLLLINWHENTNRMAIQAAADEAFLSYSKSRLLRDDSMKLLFLANRKNRDPDVCKLVLSKFPNDPELNDQCAVFERSPFVIPVNCTSEEVVVPKILHTVAETSELLPHHHITAQANPDFILNHHSDESAHTYIKMKCGAKAAHAYTCLKVPAFRTVLFRFCALVADGGVYIDADVSPLVKLEEIYAPCASATIGHDIPELSPKGKLQMVGKQMKILAGAPKAPIFQCVVDRIVEKTLSGSLSSSELAGSGPAMLHSCYDKFPQRVAITYKDAHGAAWPQAGMRRGNELLAHEVPSKRFSYESPFSELGKLLNARYIDSICPIEEEFTFPSVDQRVEYYMGDWFQPRPFDVKALCSHEIFTETLFHGRAEPSLYQPYLLNVSGGSYFDDIRRYVLPHWSTSEESLLMHLGDNGDRRYLFPVISKTRPSKASTENLGNGRVDPILVPLNIERHYENVDGIARHGDVAWKEKKESIVWRGVSTGNGRRTRQVRAAFSDGLNVAFTQLLQGEEDIKENHELLGSYLHPSEMLKHKYLLSLEGNDVAAGLKWMLAANSVVFMSKPTRVTWAMEDILIPWYHYIPVSDDMSDLVEKVEWARQNDAHCKMISEKASAYMQNLWLSDKAKADTAEIVSRLVNRYKTLYGKQLQCVKKKEFPLHVSSFPAVDKGFTFPSIDQRVEYLMGAWFQPREFNMEAACSKEIYNETVHKNRSEPSFFLPHFLRVSSGKYMDDVKKYILPHWNTNDAVFFMHLGDNSDRRYPYPIFSKTRPSKTSLVDLEYGKVDPIIAPLNIERHYESADGLVDEISKEDTAWEDKNEAIVFRGRSTGFGRRTRQVRAASSAGYNVAFSRLVQGEEDKEENEELLGSTLHVSELLQYKYLLCLEGNDVSSALKWMLASNSVVFMSEPTHVTWAMEDLLVPWYHYIPVSDDMSDLVEKVEWARQHDAACKRIADNASLYMQNLWTSEKAKKDTVEVMSRMVNRYKDLYGQQLQKCTEKANYWTWNYW